MELQMLRPPPHEGLAAGLARAAADAGLLLCHWKSNHRLQQAAAGGDDLDLSVPPEQEAALRETLRQLGFLEFLARPWQRFPGVTDWLALDPGSGALLHVHLHTRLVTGADGVMEQELPWLDEMNGALQTDPATGINVPPPAFDAHLLLAREAVKSTNLRGRALALLGRAPISPDAREEMAWLLARCSRDELDCWGARMWGAGRWEGMKPHFHDGILWKAVHFSSLRADVVEALRPYRKGSAAARDLAFLAARMKKRIHALRARVTGTTPSGKHLVGARAPIIAVVGSDGAGKSTVTAALAKWLGSDVDVATVYFGTNHGWFRRLRASVLRLLPRRRPQVAESGQSAATPARRSSFPPWLQAIKWVFMARLRLHLQRRALRLTRQGTVVLADRYPQVELHGTYDGPSRLDRPGLGRLARALQRLEHRSFAEIAEVQPDLVIKLVVPLEVAATRKADHDPLSLAERIAITRRLGFKGAATVEIDAARPFDEVIGQAHRHVWAAIRAAADKAHAVH